MCPECSEKWWKALDARPPSPPVVLLTCGDPDGRWMLDRDRRRADEHWQRVRAYQDQVKRTCAESHGA